LSAKGVCPWLLELPAASSPAERSHQLGDKFELSDFFAELDAAGVIPVSLIRWQLTGKDDEIRAFS